MSAQSTSLGPVHATAGDGLARGARLPAHLAVAVLSDLAGHAGGQHLAVGQLGGDDDDVADAALDNVRLDAGDPRAAARAVRPEGVDEDAVVARVLFAVAPGVLAPFELDHQMVVAENLLRGQIAVASPAHMQHAVLELEDVGGRVLELGRCAEVGLQTARFG